MISQNYINAKDVTLMNDFDETFVLAFNNYFLKIKIVIKKICEF